MCIMILWYNDIMLVGLANIKLTNIRVCVISQSPNKFHHMCCHLTGDLEQQYCNQVLNTYTKLSTFHFNQIENFQNHFLLKHSNK